MGGKSQDRRAIPGTGQQLPPGTMQGAGGAQNNMMTLPGSMPGQLDAISQQLGGAFGQDPAQFLAMLQQLHQPMQVQNPGTPWMPPAGGTAPTSPAGGKGANYPTREHNGRTYESFDGRSWHPQRG